MSAADRYEMVVTAWLETEGAGPAPAWLHGSAIHAAGRVRQRPRWLARVFSITDVVAPADRLPATRLLILAVVALLFAVLLAIGIGARPLPAPGLPLNGQILVARVETGQTARYLTMNADGSDERPFFEASDCGQCAFWSPDGSRILMPEVAPGDRLSTAIAAADGSAKTVLLPFPDATLNLGPSAWSRDGRRVALTGWDDASPTRRGIYTVAVDGTDLRQITTSSDERGHDFATYSPDGSRILYMALDPEPPPGGGIAGDLFVVDADGGAPTEVNPPNLTLIASTTTGRPAEWSPDGRQIAFAAVSGELDGLHTAVYVVDAEGGQPTRITANSVGAINVDWSPDGAWLLYGTSLTDVEWVSIVRPDGSDDRVLWSSELVGSPHRGCCGTWSPDGRRILFQRGDPGARDLWTMLPDGPVVTRVTNHPSDYIWYSWAPAAPVSE